MLTSQKVIDAINEQIGYEFSAELQYYAIAAHFAAEALPQLSQHFFKQAEEEKGHALRFIKYVVDAGGRVVIPALEAPKSNFKTPKDAVKLSLDQEVHVTQQINALVELAKVDRKSTRLNSSHSQISYAVFCLKKKNTPITSSSVFPHYQRNSP